MGLRYRLALFFQYKVFNIILALVCCFVVVISAITYFSYKNETEIILSEYKAHAQSISTSTREYFNGLLERNQHHLLQAELFLSDKGKDVNSDEISLFFNLLKKQTPDFEIMALTDKNGFYIANSEWVNNKALQQKQLKMTLSDRQYYAELKDNPDLKLTLSKPVYSRTTGKMVSVLAKRRHSSKNQFEGLIMVTISIEKLSQIFAKSDYFDDSTISVYFPDNTLLTRYPYKENLIGKIIEISSEFNSKIKNGEVFGSVVAFCPVDKIEKIFGFAKEDYFGLKILWGKSTDLIMAPTNKKYLILLVLEILFSVFISYLLFIYYKSLELAERQKLTLMIQSKMASIGEISAGISHEINNPLAQIMARAEKILRSDEIALSPELTQDLVKIQNGVLRIGKIIKGLKMLSYEGVSEDLISYSLEEIFIDVLSVSDSNLKEKNISFKYELPEGLKVMCRPHRLSQVILNLLSNSIYAVKDLNDKWIKIVVTVDNDKVKIEFIDSGLGINKEFKDKLFVKRFTTKPIGIGTGLGLNLSKKIVMEQGGDLALDSSAKNTTFLILLKKSV